MNKKLLFGIMSLAALTACTSDDFVSQEVANEESPIKFEVINSQDDAFTRASMDGNKIVWNAKDGDLFTLYHGRTAALPIASPWGVNGFENATYTAKAEEGKSATLATPSMIKQGFALMVWPVDTTFRIKPANNLSIVIPADQPADIQNKIPYVSDLINIGAYGNYNTGNNKYNTAGKDRMYPVYMRPMASQLIVKADYVNTDAKIAELYEGGKDGLTGDDAIKEITLTSVDLLTKNAGTTLFTTEIPLKFEAAADFETNNPGIDLVSPNGQWTKGDGNNAWNAVTEFDLSAIASQANKLTTKVITGTESCKFLLLPQAAMSTPGAGVLDGGIIVNTYYGRVVIADNGQTYNNANYGYKPAATGAVSAYTGAEYAKAWYRYVSATTAAADGETKAATETSGKGYKTTANIEMGLKQTINVLSSYTHQADGIVKGEPEGAAATRYVEVRLNHLDMSDLHVKDDKQLRDVVRVWQKLNLPSVTVLLDGNKDKEFKMSQKTIKLINDINAATANTFTVMPCKGIAGEVCNTIVITGGGDVPNIPFITYNDVDLSGTLDATEYNEDADVALNAGETWNWKGTVKVADDGVVKIINRGTMENGATATLKTTENGGAQNNVPFVNDEGANWNITAGTLNVQFDVTNNGTVTISKGAQYRQDGQAQNTVFTNDAKAKPGRFGGNDAKIGVVWNYGVFATVAAAGKTADINNFGLIEHADKDAKTYVTTNQTTNPPYAANADFTKTFKATVGSENKIGRINLPWSNKDEDNVSVSAALTDGFVSVTVDGEATGALDATVVGPRVNYVIVKSGITSISNLPAGVKYLEINMTDKSEIAWSVTGIKNFDGLMVLTPVNIKLGTTINAGVTYLGSDMYVGGTFNIGGTDLDAYYGDTSSAVSSKYITY